MKASYDKWRKRLAGEKVPTFTEPDADDAGFYRMPVKEKQPNGRWKTLDYKPVALFVSEGFVICQIGSQIVDEDKRNDAWTWFVQNPITEEVWRAVCERGEPWPDFKPVAPPTEEQILEHASAKASEVDADVAARVRAEIANAAAELPKFAKIESDEQSSAARSLQQRFLDARGDAKREYEAANRPLLDAQEKLRKIWFPLRDEADTASNKLREAMGAWEDFKREQARKAQIEADRIAREHEEAARKAEAANKPAPAPPPTVAPNAPPPAAQIKAAGARTASVTVKKIVTEIDIDKAFAQFKRAPEVRETLLILAQRAINAGLPVDGATVEEKSVVK